MWQVKYRHLICVLESYTQLHHLACPKVQVQHQLVQVWADILL
jgi:hypothetical protein